jgi:dephospho-CoA kinase
MTIVLVTGMSGTGKSSALAELSRRGYRTLNTDEAGWTRLVESTEYLGGAEPLWIEDRMAELLDSTQDGTLFVSGCVRNQVKFYERFDAIVLLSAPADLILERIATRTNPFGRTPEERERILHDLKTVEPLLRQSCTHELDASRSIREVVEDLIAVAASAL